MGEIKSPETYRLAELKDRKGDLSKRWYIEYYALNQQTGKLQRSKFIYCPATRKTAVSWRKWAKENCHKINQLLTAGYIFGTTEPEPTLTFDISPETAAERTFLQHVQHLAILREKTHRKRTSETIRYLLSCLTSFCKHTNQVYMLLSDVTIKTGYEFSDYIIQVRKSANRTRNNLMADFKTLLNELVKREYISSNPLEKVEMLIEEGTTIHEVYSPQQRQQLVDYLLEYDRQLYYFTQFIYQGFIRPAELVLLRVADVNLDKNVIKIHSSFAKGGRKSVRYETVVITETLRRIIDQMDLTAFQPTDFLFGKKLMTGNIATVRNRVSEQHRAALEKTGLYNGDLTLYSWKHTGVSNAYSAGADVVWLQKQLRHASLDDTQTYLRSLGLLPIARPGVSW